jgi:hypothetical protein
MPMIEFRKASDCGDGVCVEVSVGPEIVLVRDSKQAGQDNQPVLMFDPEEWATFTAAVKRGEFDGLPH